jgi:hypothetical protein
MNNSIKRRTFAMLVLMGGLATSASSQDWTTTGNAGTSATTNFIGTTDLVPFVTKINNLEAMRFTPQIGGGTNINMDIGTASNRAYVRLLGTNPSLRLEGNDASYYPNITIKSNVGLGQIDTYGFNGGHGMNITVWNNGNPIGFGVSPTSGNFSQSNVPSVVTYSVVGAVGQTADVFQVLTRSGATHLLLKANGNLGLGTTTPSARLHSKGTVRFEDLVNDDTKTRVIVSDNNGNLSYRDASTLGGSGSISGTVNYLAKYSSTNAIASSLIYDNGTSVGIGTVSLNGDYKLFVEAGIRTRKVKVDVGTWPDYVFAPDYTLPSLQEIENFITRHNHLPDMPTAADVADDGLNLGDNQALLLKKIEELTLHLIELNKTVQQLKADNEELKQKVK